MRKIIASIIVAGVALGVSPSPAASVYSFTNRAQMASASAPITGGPGSSMGFYSIQQQGVEVTGAPAVNDTTADMTFFGMCVFPFGCDYTDSGYGSTTEVQVDPALQSATVTISGPSAGCGYGLISAQVSLVGQGDYVPFTSVSASGPIGPGGVAVTVAGGTQVWRNASVSGGTVSSPCLGTATVAAGGTSASIGQLLAGGLSVSLP